MNRLVIHYLFGAVGVLCNTEIQPGEGRAGQGRVLWGWGLDSSLRDGVAEQEPLDRP